MPRPKQSKEWQHSKDKDNTNRHDARVGHYLVFQANPADIWADSEDANPKDRYMTCKGLCNCPFVIISGTPALSLPTSNYVMLSGYCIMACQWHSIPFIESARRSCSLDWVLIRIDDDSKVGGYLHFKTRERFLNYNSWIIAWYAKWTCSPCRKRGVFHPGVRQNLSEPYVSLPLSWRSIMTIMTRSIRRSPFSQVTRSCSLPRYGPRNLLANTLARLRSMQNWTTGIWAGFPWLTDSKPPATFCRWSKTQPLRQNNLVSARHITQDAMWISWLLTYGRVN